MNKFVHKAVSLAIQGGFFLFTGHLPRKNYEVAPREQGEFYMRSRHNYGPLDAAVHLALSDFATFHPVREWTSHRESAPDAIPEFDADFYGIHADVDPNNITWALVSSPFGFWWRGIIDSDLLDVDPDYVPRRYDAPQSIDEIRALAQKLGDTLRTNRSGKDLPSKLYDLFPELEEHVASALSQLETEVAAIMFPGQSRNEVQRVVPRASVPFYFKVYPESVQHAKEAARLQVLAQTPLQPYTPGLFASGNFAGADCNSIEDVSTRPYSLEAAIQRNGVYAKAEHALQAQGINLKIQESDSTQLMYVLALLHHEGKSFMHRFDDSTLEISPVPYEQLEQEMAQAKDLDTAFLRKSSETYRRLLEAADQSYELSFIHGDPLSRNVAYSPESRLFLPGKERTVFLVDWESGGYGPIETDLSRATLEKYIRTGNVSEDIAKYAAFRAVLANDPRWVDLQEMTDLDNSVEFFRTGDMIRQVWGIGRWYREDSYHMGFRQELIRALEPRFDSIGQR